RPDDYAAQTQPTRSYDKNDGPMDSFDSTRECRRQKTLCSIRFVSCPSFGGKVDASKGSELIKKQNPQGTNCLALTN
ncbi:MAG: hypothetical protein Q4G11_06350, partial [Gallicola sp.]|nr:hypothetical protein [Gallicola sp.]